MATQIVELADPARYDDMFSCLNCGKLEIFRPVEESADGRTGYCLGCGEKRTAPFTRVTGEAA